VVTPAWLLRLRQTATSAVGVLDVDRWAALARRVVLNAAFVCVVGVLAFALIKELATTSVVVPPVAVPPSFSDAGYSPEVVARRIAGNMRQIDTASGTMMVRDRIGESGDLPDIRVPSQDVSLRTIAAFLEATLGLEDTTVYIDIATDDARHVARVRVDGGPYDGNVTLLSAAQNDAIEPFLFLVAAKAMELAQPYVFGSFLMSGDERLCATASECITAASVVFRALRLNAIAEDDWWAEMGLTNAAMFDGRFEDALRHCTAAIEMDSASPFPYVNCVSANAYLGQVGAAREQLEAALRIGVPNAAAYNVLGDSLLKLKDPALARTMYERAHSLSPTSVYSLIGLGTASLQLCEPAEGARWYQEAIMLDPSDALSHARLARALGYQGKVELAVVSMERALQRAPENSEFQKELYQLRAGKLGGDVCVAPSAVN
jgi:tetratricopeptide (TPR) repeat protein